MAVYLDPKQILVFFRQARELGLKTNFFGSTTFQSNELIAQADGSMEGVIFPHNYVEPSFRSRFMQQYGTDQQIAWAANAYDFAALVIQEFTKPTNHLNGLGFIERASKIQDGNGVGGPFKVIEDDGDRYFQYPVVLYRIKGRNYTLDER